MALCGESCTIPVHVLWHYVKSPAQFLWHYVKSPAQFLYVYCGTMWSVPHNSCRCTVALCGVSCTIPVHASMWREVCTILTSPVLFIYNQYYYRSRYDDTNGCPVKYHKIIWLLLNAVFISDYADMYGIIICT